MTTQPETTETAAQRIDRVAAEIGLTMTAEFVPFSKSRNKSEKSPSLNWIVTILRNGRGVLTTDYMAGSAHCPAYKGKDRAERSHMVAFECEKGQRALGVRWGSQPEAYGGAGVRNAILPELRDVLYSLALDADVIDCGTFEEWAGNYGYEIDSRSAERTYRACLEIALKLRAGIGENGLTKLREACQDY